MHERKLPQLASASKLRISPGSHSTTISKGRQQISQSVVNRWNGNVVSITTSNACPQYGHRMFSDTSTRQRHPAGAELQTPSFTIYDGRFARSG
jgi:hypothetical protein